MEPRLAPDALLAGAALVSSALAGGLETDIASDEATIEEPTSSDLTADTGSSLEAYALLDDGLEEDELADFIAAVDELDADALHALAVDLLEQRADPSERVLGVIDAMDDAVLNDFVLFLAALNNDLSLESVFADPVAEGGTTTLSGGSGIILGDAVASPGLYSRSEGGVGGLGGDLFAPMFFQPEGYYNVEVSIDGDPVGIEITGPASYVWVPPGGFSSAPVEVTPVVVNADTYTGRVTFEDQEETDTIYVVDTTDVTPQWQQPDTGAWAAPDTFLADGLGVPVLWSHDNLRWIASFSHDIPVEAEPEDVTLEAIPWSDWLQRADQPPIEAWPTVAEGGCTDSPGAVCIAYGGPGVGDWAVRATVWYNGGAAGGGGGGGGEPARQLDPERAVVAEIQSLSWQQATGTSAGELQGDRFYPDAAAAGGLYRPQVDVLVQVTPNNLPIEVHFKAFDVDDPVDSDGPIDVDPNPAGDNGVDNFGGAGWSLQETSKVVTGQGTVRFNTTFQPGDNFRVAGSLHQTLLDLTKALAPDSASRLFLNLVQDPNDPSVVLDPEDPFIDELNPAHGVHTTPRLTVWRKLRIELDSMGPIFGNDVIGTTGTVVPDAPGLSKVPLNVDPDSPQRLTTDTPNRFEGGFLAVNGVVFTVVSSGTDHVIVQNGPQGQIPASNSEFDLHDDDSLALEANVPEPKTELLSLYGDVYITPIVVNYDPQNGPNFRNNKPEATAINVSEINDGQHFKQLVNAQKDLPTSQQYWTAYVMGAFQGSKGKDHDPGTEIPAQLGTSWEGSGSMIFLETIPDRVRTGIAAGENWDAVILERQTLVHEIGHQFEKLIGWEDTIGIMRSKPPADPGLTGNPDDNFFSEEAQLKIRESTTVNEKVNQ